MLVVCSDPKAQERAGGVSGESVNTHHAAKCKREYTLCNACIRDCRNQLKLQENPSEKGDKLNFTTEP